MIPPKLFLSLASGSMRHGGTRFRFSRLIRLKAHVRANRLGHGAIPGVHPDALDRRSSMAIKADTVSDNSRCTSHTTAEHSRTAGGTYRTHRKTSRRVDSPADTGDTASGPPDSRAAARSGQCREIRSPSARWSTSLTWLSHFWKSDHSGRRQVIRARLTLRHAARASPSKGRRIRKRAGRNTPVCQIPLGPLARFLGRFATPNFDPAVSGSESWFKPPSHRRH